VRFKIAEFAALVGISRAHNEVSFPDTAFCSITLGETHLCGRIGGGFADRDFLGQIIVSDDRRLFAQEILTDWVLPRK
jgi:hypothetical protein